MNQTQIILITKEMVEKDEYLKMASQLIFLSSDARSINQMKESMELRVEGYESGAISQPEVGAFFRKVSKIWPYWAHFLSNKENSLVLALNLAAGVSGILDSKDGPQTTFHPGFCQKSLLNALVEMNEASDAMRNCHEIQKQELVPYKRH